MFFNPTDGRERDQWRMVQLNFHGSKIISWSGKFMIVAWLKKNGIIVASRLIGHVIEQYNYHEIE